MAMKGALELMGKLHEEAKQARENLAKLQTNPPNLVKIVDCCLSCKARYMDDSEYSLERAFCTKHKMWVLQTAKCDDFKRIDEKYINGEGEEPAHQVIRDLIKQKAW